LNTPDAIWYLQFALDRKVAYPGETLYASATVTNPHQFPLFLGEGKWDFTCYPNHLPATVQVNKMIPVGGAIVAPPWFLPVPEVPEGQYEAHVSFETWGWNKLENGWYYYGNVITNRGEPFHIIHQPRFRAFISRSNYDIDRPIVDSIVSTIQRWGFDTHTVGINELEDDSHKVPNRILQEILKSDCVFAIATPRDISSLTNLVRTFTWLQNEVAFSFMAQKPTLLIADTSISLDGLAGFNVIPTVRYTSVQLDSFLLYLNQLMPLVRTVLIEEKLATWQQQRIDELEKVRYEGIVAGMLIQKKLLP